MVGGVELLLKEVPKHSTVLMDCKHRCSVACESNEYFSAHGEAERNFGHVGLHPLLAHLLILVELLNPIH